MYKPTLKTIITTGEARKYLTGSVKHLTDGELEELVFRLEQLIRYMFRLRNSS